MVSWLPKVNNHTNDIRYITKELNNTFEGSRRSPVVRDLITMMMMMMFIWNNYNMKKGFI
jgi:hypothetical protein